MPNAGTPVRSAVAGGAPRSPVADILDGGHGVAQLANPFCLVLRDQTDAPRQRLAAAARHSGVDQRVKSLAVVHAEPGHDRHTRRREEDARTPTLGSPRHGAAEGRLGLVGDAYAGDAALLPETADAGLLGDPHLVLAPPTRAGGW